MEHLTALKNRPKSSTPQITRNAKIFKTIIKAIEDKKGENIISMDLRKIHEATTDFFIICEANNTTQLKAIADNVEYEVKTNCSEWAYKSEGKTAAQWLLIDYINIVVHIMHPESRNFYRLEEMWSDADTKMHDL
ncbi:MAG: ribosome silencing factor [Chitinophagaceae bacterium]|nr:ribosome silencing factor [Chitinophagaceae bacterium]